VARVDLRYFVGHPAQVVIRVPEVLAALCEIVDVVFLEVPSYLSEHYGEGLTPLADVVLVVAERESTTVGETRRLSAILRRLDAPVVGMALTEGGLEMYDWGLVEAELEEAEQDQRYALDPTEEIRISRPSGDVPAARLDDVSVAKSTPQEI
jgi:hypothetical protein